MHAAVLYLTLNATQSKWNSYFCLICCKHSCLLGAYFHDFFSAECHMLHSPFNEMEFCIRSIFAHSTIWLTNEINSYPRHNTEFKLDETKNEMELMLSPIAKWREKSHKFRWSSKKPISNSIPYGFTVGLAMQTLDSFKIWLNFASQWVYGWFMLMYAK